MIYWRVGWVLAILQILCAVFMTGRLWMPWTWFDVVNATLLWQLALFTANILFLILPVIALVGMLRRRRFGFMAIAVFPVVAWVFGTMPIPFSSEVLPFAIATNSWIISIVNALAVVIGVTLFLRTRKGDGAVSPG